MITLLDWMTFASLAIIGGFIVGNIMHNFVSFVIDVIKKQDRDK